MRSIWQGEHPLILASQSRARQMLLTNAGITFEAVPADIDERALQQASGLKAPGDVALLLAKQKAGFVSGRNPGRYVVGADQTLALGERLFDKPVDRAQAADHLRELVGRTHELHAAVAVTRDGQTLFADVSVARMHMRAMTDSAISLYLDAAGAVVTSSVGAYQVEGLGVHLFARIEGDHFTILGLPLLPLLAFLHSAGLIAL